MSITAWLARRPAPAVRPRRSTDGHVCLGRPMPTSGRARRPFYRQTCYRRIAGSACRTSLRVHALRDRGMDDMRPVARMYAAAAPTARSRLLHCVSVTFVGQVAHAGRRWRRALDGAVTIGGRSAEGRASRRSTPSCRSPARPRWSRYARETSASLRSGRGDGRLVFSIELIGPGLHADFKPSVAVDPARLPATVELGGARSPARLGGRRASVRVDRPFPRSRSG